jgi:hypothetical protein
MSDIQRIIELIEEGHRNSDHGDGRRQINEAVAMLKKMQEDSNLHSGQRWELSQILECGTLYKDIEKAVKEMKESAVALRMIQLGEDFLSSQRHKLSKILECKCCYDDIEKAVRALKEGQSWQPIETADMDCGDILAYKAGDGCIYRTSYSREEGVWLISNTNETWHPTYWIPLPEPPSLAESE